MVELYGQGKLLIRPPKLSGNSTSRHLVTKQGGMATEATNFAYEICLS
jgi:hypothetical protein